MTQLSSESTQSTTGRAPHRSAIGRDAEEHRAHEQNQDDPQQLFLKHRRSEPGGDIEAGQQRSHRHRHQQQALQTPRQSAIQPSEARPVFDFDAHELPPPRAGAELPLGQKQRKSSWTCPRRLFPQNLITPG
jgi:hypothetical protein